jgi:hypothetical protein
MSTRLLHRIVTSSALVAGLAAAATGGCTEVAAPDEDELCEGKCDDRFAGISISFNERLSGRFHAGQTDASPSLLDGMTASGVHAEIRVKQTIRDLARFLGDYDHAVELSGEIELAALGARRNIVAAVEDGSFFSYLPVNTRTGEREFRYHVRFRVDGELFVLDLVKFVQRDTPKPGVLDDLVTVLPEILRDTSIAYGTIRRDGTGAPLGTARLVFPGVESLTWADVVDAGRFFTSFTVTGGDPFKRLAARHRLNTLTSDILTDTYFPSLAPIDGARVRLDALTAQPTGSELCAGRTDELCASLAAAESPAAAPSDMRRLAQLIAASVAADRPAALRDPVVHHFVRERGPALFAYHRGAQLGRSPARVLAEHYPAHAIESFALAHAVEPPAAPACGEREALVFTPGLYRAAAKNEMREAFVALRSFFPCLDLVRADPPSYATRQQAADALHAAVRSLPAGVPIHLLAHSAGAGGMLLALAQHPELAARVRTVGTLQPTVHGTEVASLLDQLLLGISGRALEDQTPASAARFWAEHGNKLPRDVLYVTLRGIALYPELNVPTSNRLFFRHLRGVDGMVEPYNDMQARLSAQLLGGSVAQTEVLAKVLEGNHYQWGLARGDVSSWVMPPEMADRIPRAAHLLGYYQALHEIGLFAPR